MTRTCSYMNCTADVTYGTNLTVTVACESVCTSTCSSAGKFFVICLFLFYLLFFLFVCFIKKRIQIILCLRNITTLVNKSFFFLSLRKIGKKNTFFLSNPVEFPCQPSLPTPVSLSKQKEQEFNHPPFNNLFLIFLVFSFHQNFIFIFGPCLCFHLQKFHRIN